MCRSGCRLLFVAIILQVAFCESVVHYCSVAGNNRYQVVSRPDESTCAEIEYSSQENHTSYFGHLKVSTYRNCADSEQAYQAGFLEGDTTAPLIYSHYNNTICRANCSGYISPKIQQFFKNQTDWIEESIQQNPLDNYWRMVNNSQRQFQGLADGYRNSTFGRQHPLPTLSFQFINAISDFYDIRAYVEPEHRPDILKNRTKREDDADYDHCTVLIKATNDFSDIILAHNTWSNYYTMLRIFKRYQFSFNNPLAAATQVAFSSYPGTLSSADDYYQTDAQLVVMDTTNDVFNSSLYDLITAKSLLSWQRMMLANFMARSGESWQYYYSMHNSGTYNNQYMIVNYGLFRPRQALAKGTLWIVEQIPGLIVGGDVTSHLQRGYWPSYNIPFFHQIYNLSGYALLDQLQGKSFNHQYQMGPRARILRRNQSLVSSVATMQKLIRYNNFQADPFSEQLANNTICARKDLMDPPLSYGCIDGKITSAELMQDMSTWVISGPTSDDQEPFTWSKTAFTDRHYNQSDTFAYSFELFTPHHI